MSAGDLHAEWLGLVEVSGPFVSLPVLQQAFPQGLDQPDAARVAELRRARRELAADDDLHGAWIRWVLAELLELGPVLRDGADVPSGLSYREAGTGASIRPSFAVLDPRDSRARLLVRAEPPPVRTGRSALARQSTVDGWRASPIDRMAALLRATEVPVGLVTDGIEWVLVHARANETTGTCTWNVDYWLEERPTLHAFWSLLSSRRFFAVAADDVLEALFERSGEAQAEVTDQLGRQVRRAVELLVQDLARRESGLRGGLPRDVEPPELYRACVSVAMRLVFLLVAEERRLLPLDDERYARDYAVSTLREQLQLRADRDGEQPLESSGQAWHRLLALFRAVHGGLDHDQLRLPAYGGGLFDPDRYPFLEGRLTGSAWRGDRAAPVRISDRTILHVLDAIQVLRPRGAKATPLALSFAALDVEQIGHVYEGLLDHTAVRTNDAALGLWGKRSKDGDVEPELALGEIEEAAEKGNVALRAYLRGHTKLTAARVEQALDADPDGQRVARLRTSCRNDEKLFERALPYLGLVRDDLRGYPLVFLPGEAYVTDGLDRRSSGTHYTPRAMAEEVVEHALAPLVHTPGPQDDADASTWGLKPVADLLDLKVCDITMGSGAFLVAACRYLAGCVQDAWDQLVDGEWTVFGRLRGEHTTELALPGASDEREQLALRLVAERCLYGVDVNPMAVEMAKASLWLITLAKDRPFSFLDHALRTGDSLLGITDVDQMLTMSIDRRTAERGSRTIWAATAGTEAVLVDVQRLREELATSPADDPAGVARQQRAHGEAQSLTRDLRLVADLIVGADLGFARQASQVLGETADAVSLLLAESSKPDDRSRARTELEGLATGWMSETRLPMRPAPKPFHWPLEFPEVWTSGGFDAIVGNPPFIGNKYWRSRVGAYLQPYTERRLGRRLGKPDLAALFMERMSTMVRRDGASIGVIATQSVTEVDSQKFLARHVYDRMRLTRAKRRVPWPGRAAVTVSLLWLGAHTWAGSYDLDGTSGGPIGSDLRRARKAAEPLVLDTVLAFQGIDNSRGRSLVLPPWHPVAAGFNDESWIRQYVSGEDLLRDGAVSPSQYVMDLTGFAEQDLLRLPDGAQTYLYGVVQPERTPGELTPYRGLAERWWTFWNTRERQLSVVRRSQWCIALPAVAKYTVALRVSSAMAFTNQCLVWADQHDDLHLHLAGPAFDIWAETYGGSFGGGRRMKVKPVARTFPLPTQIIGVSSAEEWQQLLLESARERSVDLTQVLNLVHESSDKSSDITTLRDQMASVAAASLSAYGVDLDGDLGFVELPEGRRWSMPQERREALLDWLLMMNQERSTEVGSTR